MSISSVIANNDVVNQFTTSNLRTASSTLKRELEVLRFMVDSLPDLISYVDAEGYYRFNNKTYEDWFGYLREDITGNHVKEVIGEEAFQVLEKYIEKALAGHQVSFVSSVPYKDGGTRYIHAKYVPDFYERGGIRGFFALESDITERRNMKIKLDIAAKEWRDTFDSIPDFVSIHDRNSKIIRANKALADFLHMDPEEVVGRHCYTLIHAHTKPPAYCPCAELFKNKKAAKAEFYDPKLDSHMMTAVSPLFDESGELTGYIHVMSDISERKQAEQLLKDSELKLSEQKSALEQKNIALREIIEQIEIEKTKLKENIALNVNNTLMPILSRMNLSEDARRYGELLKHHLKDLVSSFGNKIAAKSYNLTPKEIEICNMIRGRLTSKEIGNLLNISNQTVEKHRKNIRKKIKLSKKKISLCSYLHSMQ